MLKMLVLYVFLLPTGQRMTTERVLLFSGEGEFMTHRSFAMERCQDYAYRAALDMELNLAELGTGIHLKSITCKHFKWADKK